MGDHLTISIQPGWFSDVDASRILAQSVITDDQGIAATWQPICFTQAVETIDAPIIAKVSYSTLNKGLNPSTSRPSTKVVGSRQAQIQVAIRITYGKITTWNAAIVGVYQRQTIITFGQAIDPETIHAQVQKTVLFGTTQQQFIGASSPRKAQTYTSVLPSKRCGGCRRSAAQVQGSRLRHHYRVKTNTANRITDHHGVSSRPQVLGCCLPIEGIVAPVVLEGGFAVVYADHNFSIGGTIAKRSSGLSLND